MEKMIDLDKIDHTKRTCFEAVGVSKEEYDRCRDEITSGHPSKTNAEIERLGFSKGEIREAIKNARRNSDPESKVVTTLWKKRGRKEISLKEFISTMALVRRKEIFGGIAELLEMLTQSRRATEELSDKTREKIINLIEDCGTKVMVGTPFCAQWKEEHEGSSRDCPKELGCTKLYLIVETLGAMMTSQPMRIRTPLDEHLWVSVTIEGIKVIFKILKAQSIKEIEELKEVKKSLVF